MSPLPDFTSIYIDPGNWVVTSPYGVAWLITPCTTECGIEIWRADDDGAGNVNEATAIRVRAYAATTLPRFIFVDYLPNDGQQRWWRWRHVCDSAPDIEQLWTNWSCATPRDVTDAPPDGPDDDPPTDPPEDTDCVNLVNCDAAVAERCSPESAGDLDIWQYDAISIERLELTPGTDGISWGWWGKVTRTNPAVGTGGETNPQGTLKRNSTGLLYDEDWHNLNVSLSRVYGPGGQKWDADKPGQLHGGQVQLVDRVGEPGFCRLIGGAATISWDITPREEMLVQMRYRANSGTVSRAYVIARFLWYGSLDPKEAAYDGYHLGDIAWDDKTWLAKQIDNPRAFTQLDVDTTNLRQLSAYEHESIYVNDGVQEGWTSYGVSLSASDTALDGQSGVPAIYIAGANAYDLITRVVMCATKYVYVTSLPTGWKGRVGSSVATESGGTATIDCNGEFFPAAKVEVLNDLDEVIATLSPGNGGVWGGDSYEYGTALVDDSGIAACIDLEFYDSNGALISVTDVRGSTTDFYTRQTASHIIPVGAVNIVPVANRKGAAEGIACVKQFQLNVGAVACEFQCDYTNPDAMSLWGFRLPCDDELVLRLGFDQFKYPKQWLSGYGAETCKSDPDGSIALSRRQFDSSVWRHDHHVMTWDIWSWGPEGDVGLNPYGDWIYDFPRPDIGVNGWGLRVPGWYDGPLLGGGTWDMLSSGNLGYLQHYYYTQKGIGLPVPGETGDEVRGEFSQMTDFTYTMWFKPSLVDNEDYPLLTMWNNTYGTFSWLGQSYGLEKAGWQFVYNLEDGTPGATDAHEFYFRFYQDGPGYKEIRWQSGHDGACDITFGNSDDGDINDPGAMPDQFAFIALRVSAGNERTDATLEYVGSGANTYVLDDDMDAKALAIRFQFASETTLTHVALKANRDQNVIFGGSRDLFIGIVPDSGGNPAVGATGGIFDTQLAGNYILADRFPYGDPDAWTEVGLDREVTCAAGTDYWLFIGGTTTVPLDASHSISFFGENGGNANSETHSGTYMGLTTTETIDLTFKVGAYVADVAGDAVAVEVFVGNPRTGEIWLLDDSLIVTPLSINLESAYGVKAPKKFTAYDNSTVHCVGGWRTHEWMAQWCYVYYESFQGIMDEVRRYNRALDDAEIIGLFRFPGGMQRFVNTCPEIESDVTDAGETATICESAGGIGAETEPLYTPPSGTGLTLQDILDQQLSSTGTTSPSQQISMADNFD